MEHTNVLKVAGLTRTVLFVVGGILVLAACGLGTLILLLPTPLPFDTWWNSVLVQNPIVFLPASRG